MPLPDPNHYNYFRDYDPIIGRYLESDPKGLRADLNTFGYVGGDPVADSDPFGLARGGGKSYKPDFWRRPCSADQKIECVEFCRKQGRKYKSCAVTYKEVVEMKDGKISKSARMVPGSWSCECTDPEPGEGPNSPSPSPCSGCAMAAAGMAALAVIVGAICLP